MSWKRINEVPKWVRYPLTDNSNFTFYVKGKTFKYKIKVSNYKTMSQTEKVWIRKRD